MKEKVLHTIFGLSMFAGFMFMIGTAGSSDLGLIDFKTLVIHMLIGMGLFAGGFVGLKLSGSDFVS